MSLQRDGSPALAARVSETLEPERDWVAELRSAGPVRDVALADLHALLLRASRHQAARMRGMLGPVGAQRLDDLVNSAADEALHAVLGKLASFEGRSRFTTWAYKFAILEAATLVRKEAWVGRSVPFDDPDLTVTTDAGPAEQAEAADLAEALTRAMHNDLTSHQRRVAVALLIDGVPIDVLADRLGTSRGALYKTLHDARGRLRAALTRSGHLPASPQGGGNR